MQHVVATLAWLCISIARGTQALLGAKLAAWLHSAQLGKFQPMFLTQLVIVKQFVTLITCTRA